MKTILIALILFYLPDAAYAQEVETANVPQPDIRAVIDEHGWVIPGLAESRVVSPRHLPPSGFGASAAPVHITVFQPRHEVVKPLIFYSLGDDGKTIVLTRQQISIRSILKCDVGGRVFAYVVQGVGAFYDPKTRRGGYGGQYGLHYYDNNGDGKFESYEQGSRGVGPEFRVPDWVLRRE